MVMQVSPGAAPAAASASAAGARVGVMAADQPPGTSPAP